VPAVIASFVLAGGTLLAATLGSAPGIEGDTWLNGPPLGPDDLRGRVVLVEFWTFDCVNCVRTVPAIVELHRKYRDWGLVVVAVHSPEREHERDADNVIGAIERLGVTYPVVLDNDFALWNAFRNRYWPTIYLLDPEGEIVFRHVGELHEGTEPYRDLMSRIELLIANLD